MKELAQALDNDEGEEDSVLDFDQDEDQDDASVSLRSSDDDKAVKLSPAAKAIKARLARFRRRWFPRKPWRYYRYYRGYYRLYYWIGRRRLSNSKIGKDKAWKLGAFRSFFLNTYARSSFERTNESSC